jgi:hypothetical protein
MAGLSQSQYTGTFDGPTADLRAPTAQKRKMARHVWPAELKGNLPVLVGGDWKIVIFIVVNRV